LARGFITVVPRAGQSFCQKHNGAAHELFNITP
jgi:hypothetical protein